MTENFLPKIDGVTRTLARLLDHLRQQKHDALIIGPDNGLETYADYPIAAAFGIPLFFYPELKFNFFSVKLYKRLVQFQPDVIHFVDPILFGPQVMYVCMVMLPHVPRIASYHTNIALYANMFGYPWLSSTIWSLQRTLHAHCGLTLAPSESTARVLTQQQHFGQTRLWPRGVETSMFTPERRSVAMRQSWMLDQAHKTVLLYVGRVSWEKNLRVLCEAYCAMDHSHVHLVIVGDGPARGDVQNLLKDAPVTYTGYLRGMNLATAYASADVFAFPSKSETFGQVVLEAMASGLPVVGFTAEGVRDLVTPGVVGILVEEESSRTFQLGLESLVVNKEQRIIMGKEARTRALKYSWAEAMECCVDGYRLVRKNQRVDELPQMRRVSTNTLILTESGGILAKNSKNSDLFADWVYLAWMLVMGTGIFIVFLRMVAF